MKKILRNRGHGKTYDCIKLCIEQNAILVVPYQSLASYVECMARREFGREIQVVTMNDFVNKRLKGSKDLNFVFDDVEYCLQTLVGHNKIIGLSIDMGD